MGQMERIGRMLSQAAREGEEITAPSGPDICEPPPVVCFPRAGGGRKCPGRLIPEARARKGGRRTTAEPPPPLLLRRRRHTFLK